MTDPRDALRRANFRPKHGLGQNFLFDTALLDELVKASGVTAQDDVLEIGPGSGTLTRRLAARAHSVLAVEIDIELMPVLAESLADCPNAAVVTGDILRLDVRALAAKHFPGRFKVVANLPYYLTTELMTKLLLTRLPMDTLAVMVQREVGEKMLARPGGEGYGPLALYCEYFAQTREMLDVPASCFTPPPKVDSLFMRLNMLAAPPVPCDDEAMLLRVIRSAFAMRRKTLVNNLQAAFALNKAQATACVTQARLSPTVRGEALTLEELSHIAGAVSATNSARNS